MELPVGYRFHPNDEEIISYYLLSKMNGEDLFVDDIIPEKDLCRHEPWDLADSQPDRGQSNDQVWYFYGRLDYKHANKNKKANRTTMAGFWKATGVVRRIKDRGRQEIGTKRTLVFHKKLQGPGSKAVKTDWVVHEYQAQTFLPHQTEYVLWKLKNKAAYPVDSSTTYDEGETSVLRPSDLENLMAAEQVTIPELYRSDTVDFPLFSPLSNMCDSEGISIEDLSIPPDLLVNSPSSGSSDNELAATQLADSFLDVPDEYNCIELRDASIHKHERRAVCRNLVAEKEVSSRYIELQGDMSPVHAKAGRRESAFNMQLKESSRAHLEKGRKTLQVSNAIPELKLRSNQSASTHKKGRFIHLETPASSYGPSPPSVYILNVLVGLGLFLIILCEMLIFH